jgi:hypothetical protein
MNVEQQYPQLSFKGFIQWLFQPIINWMMKGRREAAFQQRLAESRAIFGEENIMRHEPVTITDEDRARFDLDWELDFVDQPVSVQTSPVSNPSLRVRIENTIAEQIKRNHDLEAPIGKFARESSHAGHRAYRSRLKRQSAARFNQKGI